MAKTFLFDSIALLESTLAEGTHDGSTFTASDSITNHERLTDQSIGSSISSFHQNDAIRIDSSFAKSVDFIALYFSASETDNMVLYGDSLADGSNTNVLKTMIDDFIKGWNVFTFNSASYKYWFLRSNSGLIENLTEMVLGVKYDFDVNFQLGDDEYDRPLVDVVTSYGGQEYANKRADAKTEWSWRWEIPTTAMRTSLKSFKDDVGTNFKKFLYYDGTNYHWVRMSAGSLKFKRKAYDFWTTNVKLTKQLQ